MQNLNDKDASNLSGATIFPSLFRLKDERLELSGRLRRQLLNPFEIFRCFAFQHFLPAVLHVSFQRLRIYYDKLRDSTNVIFCGELVLKQRTDR